MKNIENYEAMSVQEQWDILATVANLYYNSELTQKQIAERLYTSRSKVSRMLKRARELGIVEINIRELRERNLDYEQQLKERFGLQNIRIVSLKTSGAENGFRCVTEAASYYFDSIVKPGMTVGISWGNTLYQLVQNISGNTRKNIPITVVPIMGVASVKSPERDGMALARDLAFAYGGEYRYIYAPLFVRERELKEKLVEEENIREVLMLSEHADVILTSVGSIIYKSWSNYLTVKTLESLEHQGAVGHIAGHFYDISGNELPTSLPDRMIGVSLGDVKKCREVVCVASGESKAEAILGALNGRFLDTLITDERCAYRILELSETHK